jgi:hypothetical protein
MARGGRARKELEWRERLARFGQARMSVVEFCIDEEVSTPAFYAWRKRLAGARGNAVQAEDAAAALGERHGPFAPVRVTGAVPGSGHVTVWLRDGTRLEIPWSDPDAVATVLGAILHADAERAGGQRAGGRPC